MLRESAIEAAKILSGVHDIDRVELKKISEEEIEITIDGEEAESVLGLPLGNKKPVTRVYTLRKKS